MSWFSKVLYDNGHLPKREIPPAHLKMREIGSVAKIMGILFSIDKL
jgi:hypothetical protein